MITDDGVVWGFVVETGVVIDELMCTMFTAIKP